MDLSGRYICIEEFIVYDEFCYEGSIVNIKYDGHTYYIEGYYASWLSEGNIKRYFKSLTEIRKDKIKYLLK